MKILHRIRLAKDTDHPSILALQKTESNKLGFLPGVALTEYLGKGLVYVCELRDRSIVGYVISRKWLGENHEIRPILQLTVIAPLRRMGVGRLLVSKVAAAATLDGQAALQAWTREDLPANRFWDRLGFDLIGDRKPHTARRKIALLWRYRLTAIPDEQYRKMPNRGGYRSAKIDGQSWFDFSHGWAI